MSLSPGELQELSRLIDAAMALPAADREAWLQALPDELQPLVPRLRRALAGRSPASSDAWLLPRVPGLQDAVEEGPLAARSGQQVGPWSLVEELGRGGMGSVWLASRSDGLYQRQVALKLPRLSKSASLATRMARERQIGALLEHPHIARLYDAGVDDLGRPYLVLEHVRGLNLLEHANRRRLGVRERLALMLQLCAAVSHAHSHLVVHRDLKPSNVLVDEDGVAKLLDFGVAQLLDAESGLPSATPGSARRTHTPRYAAPEQLRGGPITTATDIYALGVLLHELLTGAWPAATPADIMSRPSEAAISEEQAGLRGGLSAAALRARLRGGIDAVVQQALQADPAARHASVERLADDLRAVLEDRVPRAWAAGPLQRAALFARRHRVALLLGALALLGAALAAGLLWAEQARTRQQEQRLSQARLFMMTMFTDAMPRAGRGAQPVTGVQMIEAALARAQTGFEGQPVLRAEVLTEIAIMLRRFDRQAEALPLLEQAHALMLEHADARDPGRHIVAAQLALELPGAGGGAASAARVDELADSALAGCSADSVRCAKARAAAWAARRHSAVQRGDDAAVLHAARRAVDENLLAYGAQHAEAAVARVQLAVVLRNAGRLQEAAQVAQAAMATADFATLPADDADQLRRLQLLLDGDLGRHPQVLASLQALLAATPPQAPAATLLHRLRAQSLLALGLLDEALPATQAVLDNAARHGDRWETANAWHLRTRVLAAQGAGGAAAQAQQSWEMAVANLGAAPRSVQGLRLRRGRAELDLHAGRPQEAVRVLRELTQGDDLLRPPSPLELARSWELRGVAARQLLAWDEAAAALQQAAALWAAALPENHPWRLRNRLEQALVGALQQPGIAPPADLRAAVRDYLDVLPGTSAWRPTIEALMKRPSSGLNPAS